MGVYAPWRCVSSRVGRRRRAWVVVAVAGVVDEGEPTRDVLIIRGGKRVDTHR